MTARISEDPENLVSLWELQIEFLRIICSHEHFIPLNLPQYGPSGFVSGRYIKIDMLKIDRWIEKIV